MSTKKLVQNVDEEIWNIMQIKKELKSRITLTFTLNPYIQPMFVQIIMKCPHYLYFHSEYFQPSFVLVGHCSLTLYSTNQMKRIGENVKLIYKSKL